MEIWKLAEDIIINLGQFLSFGECKNVVENIRNKKIRISEKIYGGKNYIVIENTTQTDPLSFRLRKILKYNPKLQYLVAHKRNDETKLEELQKIYDTIYEFKNLQSLLLHISIINFSELFKLSSLIEIGLYGEIKTSQLSQICSLPNLTALDVSMMDIFICDINFSTSQIKSLEFIGLSRGLINYEIYLKQLLLLFPELINLSAEISSDIYLPQTLQVLDCYIADNNIIVSFPSNLRYLRLTSPKVIPTANLKNLEYLQLVDNYDIYDKDLSEDILFFLQKCPNLKYIHIRNFSIHLFTKKSMLPLQKLIAKLLTLTFDFSVLKFYSYDEEDNYVERHKNWTFLLESFNYKLRECKIEDSIYYLLENRKMTPNQWLEKNGYFTYSENIYNL